MNRLVVITNAAVNRVEDSMLYFCEAPVAIDGEVFLFNSYDYELSKPVPAVIDLVQKGYKIAHSHAAVSEALMRRMLSADEIDQLLERGSLTTCRPSPPVLEQSACELADLEINVSQTCNMKCEYCIVGKGEFGMPATYLSLKSSRAALDELVARTNSDAHTVTFFGGEPLLNFSVIRDTIRYANELGKMHGRTFSFRILTNGTAFDQENSAFLIENNVEVQISLDGSKEAHDRWRVLRGDKPTYGRILEAIASYFSTAKHLLTLRATMTKGNLDALAAYKALETTGISKIIVAHANGHFDSSSYDEDDLSALRSGYTGLAKFFLERAVTRESVHAVGAPFNDHIRVLASGNRKKSYCGAGVHFVGLSARGEYSYCQDLAENPLAVAGNVGSGLNQDAIANCLKRSAAVDHRPICSSCWARYICGGGCAALAIAENFDISEPYTLDCLLIRHNVALAAWIIKQLQDVCPRAFLAWVPDYASAVAG